MCMVSLYLLAILCCHTIDWDIFLRYWCLSQIYYYIIIIGNLDEDPGFRNTFDCVCIFITLRSHC